MYRPKDWKTRFNNTSYDKDSIPCIPSANEAFEVGADAMLESLKKLPNKYVAEYFSDMITDDGEFKHGTWVFIPDEE
jgi:hypothetical protein